MILENKSKSPKNWIQFILGLSDQTPKQEIHYHVHIHASEEKSYQQVLNQALSELPLAVAPVPNKPPVIRIL